MRIYYNSTLKRLARQLRNKSTVAEVMLWKRLGKKQMKGYDFHRQKPIGEYIVDFFCPKLNLVIEIDGITHDNAAKLIQDKKRQIRLESLGFYILRFWDNEVRTNIDGVLHIIEGWIEKHTPVPS
jgi:very-short-patch-repair endonuclease